MSGKLPIDRAREAADAPRIYELEKQRFTEQQAELHHETAPGQGAAGPPPDQVEDREDRAPDQDDPEPLGPAEGRERA
jgi:hypothetical protein